MPVICIGAGPDVLILARESTMPLPRACLCPMDLHPCRGLLRMEVCQADAPGGEPGFGRSSEGA